MWHVWGILEMGTGSLWGDLMEREHSEDLGIDGRCDGEAWNGLNWLRTGTDGGHL